MPGVKFAAFGLPNNSSLPCMFTCGVCEMKLGCGGGVNELYVFLGVLRML